MCDMMVLFCLFLELLFALSAGQRIGQDLRQPENLSATKGDLIALNCFYSVPVLQRFEAWWIFQNHSRCPLKIIANVSAIGPQVIHARYSATHNSRQKTFTLRITDVHFNDTGVYRCEMFKTAPPPSARPSLRLFASAEETASSPSVIVTCSAYRFYPNMITMMFQTACLTNQLTNGSSPNLDGTYNHTAFINISIKTCTNSTKFTCLVHHPASQSKINHTIFIDVHPTGEDHNGDLWASSLILLSVCGGSACIILLVLIFLIKCTCGRKGTLEQKGTRVGHGRLHQRQDNMDENNGNNICYAELKLGNMKKVRKKEEEIVYSTVLLSKSGE
ncbi:tyrosine-protein phosphatase non-receptor type substrate 1-like isoform X2 [Scyliorhinus canicula]|uniref:tyrosine-protein phosphatase non-receptor type substrate 1-like isoform X2 n=1 Tax=Scyliorhinus canicula TaxID=7830 RepID=UPI0018F52B4C|nr:tyrosine-protein phosphatase non-receptor type substrate 1-like isoform X2 [Scyliorhinus canicula]